MQYDDVEDSDLYSFVRNFFAGLPPTSSAEKDLVLLATHRAIPGDMFSSVLASAPTNNFSIDLFHQLPSKGFFPSRIQPEPLDGEEEASSETYDESESDYLSDGSSTGSNDP